MRLYWLPTNASWLDQIEIWLSVLQRKLLQPNHFASTDELRASDPGFHRSLQSDRQAAPVVLHG